MPVDVKVSVVVAVYNPGPNINGLVASLDAQSLGLDEFEIVFVDDGSTDGTGARLLEVTRTRPNVLVATIPNSGWPGRPRNVGTDLAHGEYVFYADHDDEFFPEALERMYAMATAYGSDVVYGKIVRMGRPTPYWELAKADKDHADLVEDHLLVSRSTHKLFRREFLVNHDIRFREGRVRLEDHQFMGQVLACRPAVSILASEPCYRWIHRRDGSNTSSQAVDLESYFGYFTASVQTLQTDQVESRVRDEIAVVSACRLFLAVRPRSWFNREQQDRERTAAALRTFLETCVPARLDHRLPVLKRLRVQALRSGELALFEELQRRRTRIRFGLSCTRVAWVEGRVQVGVDASLVSAKGDPFAMDQLGDDVALPAELGAPAGSRAAPCVLTTKERGTGEITIRHRQIGIEWPVNSVEHPNAPHPDSKTTLSVHVDGTVNPAHSIFGRELEAGIWDVLVRVQFLGEERVQRMPIDTEIPLPRGPQQVEGRQVLVYRTQSGTLALKISTAASSIGARTAGWEANHLVVELEVPTTDLGRQLVVRRRGTDIEQLVAVQDGHARILLGPSTRGDIFDFWLRTPADPPEHKDQRLAFGAAKVSQRPPYRIYDTIHGSFSVKHVEPPAPLRTATQRARRWLSRHRWPSRLGGPS
jgi:hypothetical protein